VPSPLPTLNLNTRWVLLPLLYAVSVLPVLVVGVFVAAQVEPLLGCHFACEIGSLLTLLVVGAAAFVLLSFGLIRLERLRPPNLLDHLRH
jgi:hypothetical protein